MKASPKIEANVATGRLWSLWDMLQKYGLLFAQGTIFLTEAKWLWIALGQNGRLGDPQIGLVNINREGVEAATEASLVKLRQALILSDMDRLRPDLDRLEAVIWPPHPDMPKVGPDAIATAITHFLSRLQDELDSQYFVHLDEQDVQFYGQKAPFGTAVVKKFPNASSDLEAAGNCLALQQPTACVFHLMRAMEVTVRRLSRRLGVTITPQTTWRQMTNNMSDKIKPMPERTEAQKRKKNDWEAARSNLHHVGSVWRNNTMHPAISYTRSQARDVYVAVRIFMASLSEL